MTDRYARQKLLPDIGEAGQKALTQARVLVIGLGGLGCPVVEYLAGAGVGVMGLMDRDTVDLTNLHRQPLYTEQDVGQPKVKAALRRLKAINSTIRIEPHTFAFDSDTASLVAGYDLILDCVDGFATKLEIARAAKQAGRPSVFAAASGYDGQVAAFAGTAYAPCLACLYPTAPTSSLIADCNQGGISGPMAGWVASLQAMLALHLLTAPAPESGQLHLCDGRSGRVQSRQIVQAELCPLCHPERSAAAVSDHVTAPQLARLLSSHGNWLLCDARGQEDYSAGHLANAIHTPHDDFAAWPAISAATIPVFYCASGTRSRAAAQIYKSRYLRLDAIVVSDTYEILKRDLLPLSCFPNR